MARRVVIVLGLVVGSAAAAAAWTLRRAETAEGGPVVVHGTVDLREVELAFRDAERVTEVLVEEGDRVTKGQVLARQDVKRLDSGVDRAAARVEAQRQVLARLERGTRVEEVQQAQAHANAAEAERANARRAAARLENLLAGGAATDQLVDDARAALLVADARREVAERALDLAQAGPRVEEVAEARARLAVELAELELARRAREDAELLAPIDAVVRSRLVEAGELAGPQRAVLTLAVTSPKWVRAYLPELALARVRPGARAAVVTDGAPDRPLAGWIGFVSPVAEFTPKTVETSELRTSLVYEVRIFVDDADDELRLGMPATVRIFGDLGRAP